MATGGQSSSNDEQELGISSPERICRNLKKQAHILELSYSSVAKFPGVAQKIRAAAFDAKSHQRLAFGVVKSIGMTSSHICKHMIPIVLKAILEKSEEQIAEAIAMTIGFIKDADTKTRVLSERYEELVKTLGNVVEVMKEHKLIQAEKEGRLKIEIEEQKQLAQVLQTALKRVDEERQRMINDITSQQLARDKLLKQIAKKGKGEADSACDFGIVGTICGVGCLFAATIVASPAVLAAAGSVVTLGSNVISAFAQRKANNETINQMAEQLTQAEVSTRQGHKELRANDDRKEEKEKVLYTHERKAKECELQKKLLCDADSLAMAIKYTGRLNGQLDFFTLFFEDLKSAFGQLEQEFKTGTLFEKLQSESHVSQLRDICNKAEKKWEYMASVCGQVATAIREDIEVNYKFLSKNYDTPTDDETNKWDVALKASIRN